jgi:sucrose-6F-phosphate phosphohydrolase
LGVIFGTNLADFPMPYEWILATDIDRTLTGSLPALARLSRSLQKLRADGKLYLILSTGRRLEQILEGFKAEGIPIGDAVISQVGTEIYLPPFSQDTHPLPAWDELLHRQFSRQKALEFIEDIQGLQIQPEPFNTSLKVSCYLDQTPDPNRAAELIRQRILEAGLASSYRVVWSSGKDLDIIPAAAGKGNAIRYVIEVSGLNGINVIVAGDSGNDLSMFTEFSHGIIVSNAQPELKELASSKRPSIYLAGKPYAAGVEQGLGHFGVL